MGPDPKCAHDSESGVDNDTGDNTIFEKTNVTEIHEDTTLVNVAVNDETMEGVTPNAESTMISNGDTASHIEEESTEADQGIQKKKKKIKIIKKQTAKLNKKMRASCCSFVV